MCVGYTQILPLFIQGTWASVDFGVSSFLEPILHRYWGYVCILPQFLKHLYANSEIWSGTRDYACWGDLLKIPKPRLHPRPIQSQFLGVDSRHKQVLKFSKTYFQNMIPMCRCVWEPLLSTELVFTKEPSHSLLVKNRLDSPEQAAL